MTASSSSSSTSAVPDGAFSRAGRQLVQSLPQSSSVPGADEIKVRIPDIADNAYWAYEQLRNAVEYQEQHLLMRSSIGRFLKRHFGDDVAQAHTGYELVRELTKTRYLANNSVPEQRVAEIDARLIAYQRLQAAALPAAADRHALTNRLVGIVSADLQDLLLPNPQQTALINFTFHSFYEHLDAARELSEAQAAALYAAVHRSLLKSDEATIAYYMFSNQFKTWYVNEESISTAGQRLSDFFMFLDSVVHGEEALRMNRLTRVTIAPYIILHSALQDIKDPSAVVARPAKLLAKATETAEAQYERAKKRLRTSVVRAIIFLFVTKMVVGLVLEVPYDYYLHGEIVLVPLLINLLFPPLYMLSIGLTIRTPDRRNTDKIIEDLRAALYGTGHLHYTLPRHKRQQTSSGFNVIYSLVSLAVLGGLSYLLYLIGFNLVSGIIFFLFLSTVSFFGYRISQSVRELQVVERRTVPDVLGSIIFTPFIRLGQWLSSRYSRINIFIIILDFIIEAPFKTLLRLYEQWLAFLREKQDDVL